MDAAIPEARPALAAPEERVAAGVIALCCLAVLVVAMLLQPRTEGHGTHTALGLPPCSWAVMLKAPCPACGMTTSFSHAANGDLPGSFRAQPFATLLAIGAAAGFWIGLYVFATGSRLGSQVARLLRPRFLWCAGALLLAAWLYKFLTWPR